MWPCARLSVKCQHYKKQNGRIFPVYVASCHNAPAVVLESSGCLIWELSGGSCLAWPGPFLKYNWVKVCLEHSLGPSLDRRRPSQSIGGRPGPLLNSQPSHCYRYGDLMDHLLPCGQQSGHLPSFDRLSLISSSDDESHLSLSQNFTSQSTPARSLRNSRPDHFIIFDSPALRVTVVCGCQIIQCEYWKVKYFSISNYNDKAMHSTVNLFK